MGPQAAARAAFDRAEAALSHRIHAHPELKWEGGAGGTWLGEALTGYGFAVQAGICQLPTAFEARAGSGPLHVVICAEYDALTVSGVAIVPHPDIAAASTDMGNVSLTIPSIHPGISIDSLPAVNHQPEFAAHCATPAADHALRDGAPSPWPGQPSTAPQTRHSAPDCSPPPDPGGGQKRPGLNASFRWRCGMSGGTLRR